MEKIKKEALTHILCQMVAAIDNEDDKTFAAIIQNLFFALALETIVMRRMSEKDTQTFLDRKVAHLRVEMETFLKMMLNTMNEVVVFNAEIKA